MGSWFGHQTGLVEVPDVAERASCHWLVVIVVVGRRNVTTTNLRGRRRRRRRRKPLGDLRRCVATTLKYKCLCEHTLKSQVMTHMSTIWKNGIVGILKDFWLIKLVYFFTEVEIVSVWEFVPKTSCDHYLCSSLSRRGLGASIVIDYVRNWFWFVLS